MFYQYSILFFTSLFFASPDVSESLFNGFLCGLDPTPPINGAYAACCGKNCWPLCWNCDYCFTFWECTDKGPGSRSALIATSGPSNSSNNANASITAFSSMDTNKDGKVSLEPEFKQILEKVFNDGAMKTLFGSKPTGLIFEDIQKAVTAGTIHVDLTKEDFGQLDANHDGKLTVDEAIKGSLEEAKKKFDLNNDGSIDKAEFEKEQKPQGGKN